MVNLGALEHGNIDEARRWYERAIATDHPEVRQRRCTTSGSWRRTRAFWTRHAAGTSGAIATDHPDYAPAAMVQPRGPGGEDQGIFDEARRWYERGDRHLITPTMRRRRWSTSGPWRRTRAISTGHAGWWGERSGRHPSRRRCARSDGQPRGPGEGPGPYETRHGRWHERAIATDHPDYAPKAMLNLGALEHEQGNIDGARRWWERAAATGHHDAATVQARQLLGDLERGEEERRRAEHFGRYGSQAYADPQLMKRGGTHPESAPPAPDEDELSE